MDNDTDSSKLLKRNTPNGWSWSIEIEANIPDDTKTKTDDTEETQIHDNDDEKSPLIKDTQKSASEIEHPIYGKIKHHHVKTTWRHGLIGPVVCLYFFGTISSYYVLIEYTNEYWKEKEYHRANISMENKTSPCDTNVSKIVSDTETRATSKASEWIVYYSIAAGVPAVLANLILGSYTDAFGRKFLLTISILGTFLRLAVTAIVIHLKADVVYLLIACVAEGFSGQHATCLAVTLAYAADITVPGKSRIMAIVVVEVLIGVSLSSASFATGYMVEALGYLTPIFINAGLLALAGLITVSVLPETFSKELRRKDKSVIQVLKVVFKFFTHNDDKNSRWKYQILILTHALTNMSFLARIPTETLYQLALPFCWSPTRVGVYAAVRTVCMMFIGLGSLKLLQGCLDEVTLCIIGNISYGAAFYWTAFVEDTISFYLVIAVGFLGPVSTTMQRTILSHLTPPDKQGAIFTAVGALEVLSQLVSNVTTSAIYSETVSYMRGLVFLVLGSYNALAIILTVILKIGWYLERRKSSKLNKQQKKSYSNRSEG